MALTGEVSDLSLGELIEFFCNQRKTGRLKLVYPAGPAYFYLQSGSVVHARIGNLRGIEAVYYALTLPNASFTFSPAFEAPEQTINQPWTSVVLEGLRRMDEGVKPRNPFPEEVHVFEQAKAIEEPENQKQLAEEVVEAPVVRTTEVSPKAKQTEVFAHTVVASQAAARPWSVGLVAAAIVLIIAAIGLPWTWYARTRARNAQQPEISQRPQNTVSEVPSPVEVETATNEIAAAETESPSTNESDSAARRQREARARERAKNAEAAAALNTSRDQSTANQPAAKSQPTAISGAKRVTVQVTYDENGRVTQASGGDATALRIARQKRFPAGKPGSATVTIPIN